MVYNLQYAVKAAVLASLVSRDNIMDNIMEVLLAHINSSLPRLPELLRKDSRQSQDGLTMGVRPRRRMREHWH